MCCVAGIVLIAGHAAAPERLSCRSVAPDAAADTPAHRRHTALTASEDGTVRLWDTATLAQKTVVKPSLPKPGRVAVTTARFNATGSLIIAGLANGSLQLWDIKGGAVCTW